MTSGRSVASVTVAWNAAAVLPRQLDALLGQTAPLQEIIVVDNASTDDTAELLRERYPQVTHLRLPSNQGVGGAQAVGLEYAALRKKHDWVWILDDDSVPALDALEQLLQAWEVLREREGKIGVLASLPVDAVSGRMNLGWVRRNGYWLYRHGRKVLKRPFWPAALVISSGSLVRREAVEKAGLPRTDFFMDAVDYEYCLRLGRYGYQIFVVRNSVLHHNHGEPRKVKFLLHKRTWLVHAPWREYYIWRNLGFLFCRLYPEATLLFAYLFLRHVTGLLLFDPQKTACLRMMVLGAWDGLRGRLGIRFVGSPGGQ